MKGKIFNAQEVQSILDGSKVMFREIAKIKLSIASYNFDTKQFYDDPIFKKCPYQVGQKIFCKESFVDFRSNNSDIFYKSDFEINNLVKTVDLKWKSASRMKQEHSRLTLEITNIKVERLQDISEDDCLDEGCYFAEVFLGDFSKPPRKIFNFSKKNLLKEDGLLDYKLAFKEYWDANHEKPEEKFKANPFVWAVDFNINNLNK